MLYLFHKSSQQWCYKIYHIYKNNLRKNLKISGHQHFLGDYYTRHFAKGFTCAISSNPTSSS